MKPSFSFLTSLVCLTSALPCHAAKPVTFSDDLSFLQEHTEVIVLGNPSDDARVVVVPAWQGRVMTSTARGDKGDSFGWVNRKLIASGEIQPHINVFGGEDRFWLGPEGGQFSIFFEKDAPFDLEHWFTPASLDTEPFKVVRKGAKSVLCQRNLQLTNYSGTTFDLEVNREVRLLDSQQAVTSVGGTLPPGVSAVAFETFNTVKNTGDDAWKKDTGLLSIWILGMFNASSESTVIIPFEKGPEDRLGPIVNDNYFGKVPEERLIVREDTLLFQADAKYRSKIGLSPTRAKPVMGSYDAANQTLTLVKFTFPKAATDYVNSMWELQKEPFKGDVVNSYNDDGNLGNFYELESSSPALALKPGATATHRHLTVHLQGSEGELDKIAQNTLGVGLKEIASAFK